MRTHVPKVAVVVGVLVALAVWSWPQGPRWRSGPKAGRLQQFSPDGAILATTQIPFTTWFDNPIVCRWDVASGQLLTRAEMQCEDPKSLKGVWVSPDGGTALVGEGKQMDPQDLNFSTGRWYLHDALTGERRAGPIAGVASAGVFSPDGRWFSAARGDPDGGWKALNANARLAVFSSSSGELVYDKPGVFATDGNSLLVADEKADKTWTISIVELPSGRELGSYVLPPRPWRGFDGWDGRVARGTIAETGPEGERIERRCAVDLSDAQNIRVVEHPYAFKVIDARGRTDRFFDDGPDWLLCFEEFTPPKEPSGVTGWFQGLLKRWNLGGPSRTMYRWKLRFVDPATGATRHQLPEPLQITIVVSPEGRYVAASLDDEAIEVWDASPFPRWPLAALAGLATTALLIFWRWRRRHSKAPA